MRSQNLQAEKLYQAHNLIKRINIYSEIEKKKKKVNYILVKTQVKI